MERFLIANLLVFVVFGGIVVYRGLDLKKWQSWFYGLYGFFSGFIIGMLRADMTGALALGALFAFAIMFGGAMAYWQRRRFGK